jgi:phosphoglucosamine mutase
MKFGTDGLRGRFGEVITTDLAYDFGLAFAASRMATSASVTLAVARDTRTSGDRLEAYLVAGMMRTGVNVIVTGIMPTSALSQFIIDKGLQGGIMITASHNGPEDNGLKPLNRPGKKLNIDERASVEDYFDFKPDKNSMSGKSYEISSGWIPWIKKIWSFIKDSGLENSLIGQKIVVDGANGAGRHLIGQALSPFGARVISIGNGEGDSINIGCGSLYPEKMIQTVRSSGAIAGIALDGDGDRIQVCDRWGKLYDGDDILWLLRGRSKAIVGTVMTNEGLSRSLKYSGCNLYRSAVGDANVAELMESNFAELGGEPSGHILFRDGMPTSCGTFTAAKLLALNPILWHQHLDGFYRTHQEITKIPIQNIDHLKEKIDQLTQSGLRIIIRESGTEPVIRIMVEGEKSICISAMDDLLSMVKK